MSDTLTHQDVLDKLIPVNTVREAFAETEPLSEIEFPMRGPDDQIARFHVPDDWKPAEVQGMDAVNATVSVGGTEWQLTYDALQEATSAIGIPNRFVDRSPGHLVEPLLNYWYSQQDKDMKFLVGNDRVLALTKPTISPFSNLRLMDEALAGIQAKYGEGDVYVDYKFHHTLRKTHLRVVVPEDMRAMRPGDNWSAGLEIRNSLTGEIGTQLRGYLFRWWCSNGCTTTHNTSGAWNRRTGGQGDEVYEWARHAVDEILGGMEHEFAAVEELANTPIDGNVNQALADVFETYRVPLTAREDIIEEMVESDDLTMYGLMQAVTQAANRDDLSENIRTSLMEIGGDLPRAFTSRCDACNRLPLE